MTRPWLALALAIAVAGCNSDEGGDPPSFVGVRISPQDASTGTDLDLSVSFDFSSSSAMLPSTLRSIVLSSARAGAIAFTSPVVSDDGERVRLALRPIVPLSTGWYALDVVLRENIHTMLSVGAPLLSHDATSSTYRTHFHVGSMPLLFAAAMQDEDAWLVGIHESEPIRIPSGATLTSLITVTSGGAVCACGPSTNTDQGYVWVRCTGVDPSAELAVSVAEGVTSLSGVPLHDLDGATSPATVHWFPSRSVDAPIVLSDAFLASE